MRKKTPYIAPQKSNHYRFFGHPGAARSSPEQSPEWLRPILWSEYPATAQPGAARSNTGFHSGFAKQQNHSDEKRDNFCIRTPFLANLDFLKSLEKVLQLYVEKHQEMSRRKIPNVERCETFQSEEPIKPFNSKTQ
jgi:hypothetical protein